MPPASLDGELLRSNVCDPTFPAPNFAAMESSAVDAGVAPTIAFSI
jgi:hypothetical protein